MRDTSPVDLDPRSDMIWTRGCWYKDLFAYRPGPLGRMARGTDAEDLCERNPGRDIVKYCCLPVTWERFRSVLWNCAPKLSIQYQSWGIWSNRETGPGSLVCLAFCRSICCKGDWKIISHSQFSTSSLFAYNSISAVYVSSISWFWILDGSVSRTVSNRW